MAQREPFSGVGAPKYKDYVLSLFFFQRLSDLYERQVDRLRQEMGEREVTVFDLLTKPRMDLSAEDNRHIDPTLYTKTQIERQITKRLLPFMQTDKCNEAILRFAARWQDVLQRLQIHFRTWEEVLEGIRSDQLHEFYDLCKRFNA